MKKIVLLAVLSGTTVLAAAQEMGRVISSTPVISQVGVPRQVCSVQSVPVQSQKSGGGAVIGAIAGGAIGSSVGGGEGRALATVLGLVGGALLGDRIEGQGTTQNQNVQSCSTQTFYENRTTAYDVVYEYAGKQYSVQMPNDPGQFVRLQITPVGASAPQAPAPNATTYMAPEAGQAVISQQVITQPVFIAAAAPTVVYPAYYARPYYPPVGINLNLGWSNGPQHGHRHWR